MSKGFTLNKNIYFFRFLFFVLFYFLTYSFSFAQTITYTDSGGTNPRSSPPYAGGYTVHTFTATGTTNFTIPLNVTSIDYLVVGGGGGGGTGSGGGGGAGGMLTGSGTTTLYSGYTYGVTVGDGGRGGDAAPNWFGTNGGTSTLGSLITALGGGGGGGNDGAENGRSGGSGGGAGYGGGSVGSGTSGQGYNGGGPCSPQAGGGGGAGEAGSTDGCGYGGDGLQSSISGTATWYAGGGGGRNAGGSAGGTGGGASEGNSGTVNTGGGGGAGFNGTPYGGSGIVILRYLTPDSNLAVLATSTATSSVTESSATFTGEVLSIGGSSITARGICYGTEHNPTTCVAEGGTGTGSFTMTLSNLATSTTYYYRSYAVNSYGTSTSGDEVFTTRGLTNSLMFDSSQSQYLSRTPSSAGNQKIWTWSGWAKLGAITGNIGVLLSAGSGGGGSATFNCFIDGTTRQLKIQEGTTVWRVTSQVFRDPSTWQHITIAFDSTQGTAANRLKLYINGIQVTVFATNNDVSLDYQGAMNNNVAHLIGKYTGGSIYYDGYLSDVNFIDGQALTPSSFGQNDSNTGNWIPKVYSGTYGNNGFHLTFSSSTSLGLDTAPLDASRITRNNWTTNGGMSSTTNQVIDNPLNNFATLNPNQRSSTLSISKGNLTATLGGGYYNIYGVMASMPIKDFDTYFEAKLNYNSRTISSSQVGVVDWDAETNRSIFQTSAGSGSDANAVIAHGGGDYIKIPGSSTSDGVSYTTSDTIMVAVSPSLRKVWFGKNGTWNNGSNPANNTGGHTFASSSVTGYFPIFRVNPDADTESATLNFGQKAFAYNPPTGFKSLSTANLPTPTILKPNEHFDVATRTGTAASYIKNGLAFKPDFIWNKGRNGVTAHYLQDIVRGFGASKSLSTNTSNAEGTDGGAPTLHSLNPTIDGYTLSAGDSNLNTNGTTYVDWLWKAGNATTTNTAGSITSTISTNSIAGFTAGTFTIPSSYSNATVGHGLGSIPSFIIFRPTNVTSTWYVWHKSLASNQYLGLNLTDSTVTNSNLFNGQATTTFTLGNSSWFGGVSYPAVFYAFTEVPGYSKFGTYTGNGSTDGPFIYTGFKPRYVMLKVTNAASNWVIIDTERRIYNVNGTELQANSGVAEIAPGANSDNYIDMLSNGFKIRGIRGDYNNSGSPIIYAAFAESVLIPTVPSLPTLSSLTATSTTETTAVLGATVDTIGGSNVTARGICYGTAPTPTNCTQGTGTSTGIFTVSITGLATSTTYYYRAYATNSYGTAYSIDSAFTTTGISHSLMFDSASSQYLNRTPSVAGNQQKWTYSFWVKRSMFYAQNNIQFVLATAGSGAQGFIGFGQANNSDEISFGYSGYVRRYTSALFRDPSAWQHVVLKVDTTATAEADRAIFYVNGVQASMVTPTTISQNDTTQINQAVSTLIGNQTGQPYGRFDGYLSDVNFIDGQALTPSSFGENASSTGNWIPKSYTGTYGTNGFRLNFNNSNLLGADSSGNSNHWSLNGGITAANNQVIDTPINNFAVLTPLMKGSNVTLASGNLKQTGANSASTYQTSFAPFVMKTGKWYWEATQQNAYWGYIGSIIEYSRVTSSSDFPGYYSDGYTVDSYDGKIWNNNSTSATYSAMPIGGTRMVAYDADAGKLWIGQNGSWFNSGLPANGTGEVFSNITAGDKVPAFMVYAGTGAVNVNFGQGGQSGLTYYSDAGGKFKYEPPTGFKALSTANLPTPTILKPNQHFDTVTYTGNSSSKSISTLNFKPDLVWIKGRSYGSSNHIWNDAVRGPNKTIFSNQSLAEYTDRGVESFDINGFSMSGTEGGDANADTQTYVAWNWKGGNSTTTNTSGTITSIVSANQTAGFSIVKYTGTGNAGTLGHGLNATPAMIIIKNTSGAADHWPVYHQNLSGPPYAVRLNLTNAQSTSGGTGWWNNATPTPTTFSIGPYSSGSAETNTSGNNYIAYAFSEVPGYSKFGSYTGNGSTDGPFVYTGFKPRYVLFKRVDAGTEHWGIWDTSRDNYNPLKSVIYSNLSNAEADVTATYGFDILSNGFKLRSNNSNHNTSGATYIYAAFAESIMIPIVASSTSSSSSTITPPSDVTVTPGNGQATIDYTISPTSNFTEILVLRSNQDITDVPTDGVDYSVGNAIGSASVGCVDSTISTSTENVFDSCVATGLSNSTLYYFKVYSKDASGNYSLIQSVEGASTTPSVGATAVTVTSYRLRKDDGGEVTANYSHSENTPMNTGFISGDKRRIRFVVSNQTASLTKKRYQLEYAVTPCSSWTVLPKANEATNQHFRMDLSPFVPDNSTTTRSNGVTAPNGKTFVPGRMQTFNNLTYPIVLRENQFTEVEYSVRATNNVALNTSYCFRATGYGDAADFTYTNTPQISSLSTAYRYQGGGTGGSQLSSVSILKIEDPTVVATTSQTGGDQGGTAVSTSTTVEATSTPASQQSTTTPTRKRGGGGATGYEPPKNNYAYSAVKDSLTFMNLFIKELANYQLKSTAINAYAYQECNLKGLIFIKTGECEHLDMYGDNKSKLNLNILWSIFNKIEEIGK